MGNVVIYSDSTCDLSEKLIKENNIKIMPLYVTFDQDVYKDGVDITVNELYEKVEKLNKLPKTSAASVGDFMNLFTSEFEKGNEVIFFTISSGLSSTYQNALIAKDTLNTDKVEIIDSLNLSSGIGLQILKACKYRDQGKNIHEIKEELAKITPNVKSKFAIESLEYLHKGGRCSGASRLFGTLLQIKPVIAVINGKMDVDAKTRGKRKALEYMLEDIIEKKDNVDLDCVMVTHSLANEEAIELKSRLEEHFPNVEITDAGCVISSHCGKGTIGILYISK